MKPSYTVTGADLVGRVQGVHTSPPPPPRDDPRLSNTTRILPKQKKTLCFIGAEIKHETRLKNYVKRRKIVVKMVVP